jgi:hypothetical protein
MVKQGRVFVCRAILAYHHDRLGSFFPLFVVTAFQKPRVCRHLQHWHVYC